jgi:YgiT-type zinc finger domain-containing protein
MEKRKSREEKWEELEQRVKARLEEARKKALLADSFDEMEEIVDEIGQVIEQDLLGVMAEQREVGGRPNCPECGQPMSRRGRKSRQIKSGKGDIRFERDRWICPVCGATFFPPG